MIEINFDNRGLAAALTQLSRAASVGLGPIIKEESRYLVQLFIKFTPPKNRAQGRKAIEVDLQKAVGLLDQNSFARAREEVRLPMRELIRRRDNVTLEAAMRAMDGNQWIVKDMTPADHVSKRNRYGRVRRKSYVMTTDKGVYRKYLRDVQSRVGWTASGWIPAAKASGARYKRFSDRFGSASGFVNYYFGPAGTQNPYLTAVNRKVKIPNYQDKIDAAFRSRTETTMRKVKRLLAGKAVNLGFTRVDGAAPVVAPPPPSI
jgi:hypothetical protein